MRHIAFFMWLVSLMVLVEGAVVMLIATAVGSAFLGQVGAGQFVVGFCLRWYFRDKIRL